jgi:hypothetical protein
LIGVVASVMVVLTPPLRQLGHVLERLLLLLDALEGDVEGRSQVRLREWGLGSIHLQLHLNYIHIIFIN